MSSKRRNGLANLDYIGCGHDGVNFSGNVSLYFAGERDFPKDTLRRSIARECGVVRPESNINCRQIQRDQKIRRCRRGMTPPRESLSGSVLSGPCGWCDQHFFLPLNIFFLATCGRAVRKGCTTNSFLTMPQRAAKRRKLSEELSEESGSDYFQAPASYGAVNAFDDEESSSEELNDTEDINGHNHTEDVGDISDSSEAPKHSKLQSKLSGQKLRGTQDKSRNTGLQQDGVYTGEIYKSNLFKLQVDQLLKQAKPKYGAIEKNVGSALTTLKAIIEGIPSREPMTVRIQLRYLLSIATLTEYICRYRTPNVL